MLLKNARLTGLAELLRDKKTICWLSWTGGARAVIPTFVITIRVRDWRSSRLPVCIMLSLANTGLQNETVRWAMLRFRTLILVRIWLVIDTLGSLSVVLGLLTGSVNRVELVIHVPGVPDREVIPVVSFSLVSGAIRVDCIWC